MRRNMKHIYYYILLGSLFLACDKGSSDSSFISGGSGNEVGTGGKGGSMARFAISGNTLFTVNEYSLKSFDISNPKTPIFNSESQIGTNIETIFPKGNFLFIGSQTGMYIYDVSNPSAPVRLSVYNHVVSCDPVVANDDYAFVTLRSSNTNSCFRGVNTLEIIDIKDPRNPKAVKIYPMTSPKGLGIDVNLNLFVCDEGLKQYDITDVLNIQLQEHFTSVSPFDVIPIGNRLLLIGDDGFYQYLIDNGKLILLSKIPIG